MDYTSAIPNITEYIARNISNDTFSSMHLERKAGGNEKLILSFTAEIPASHRRQILGLARNPGLIVFRRVDFSQNQLMQKQREIDRLWNTLAREGIQICHTHIDAVTNRVEIGIDPYTKAAAAKLRQRFDPAMIQVVQGHPATPLPVAGAPARRLPGRSFVSDRAGRFLNALIFRFKKSS